MFHPLNYDYIKARLHAFNRFGISGVVSPGIY